MTTINPTYIQIVAPVVAGLATVFPVAVGRNISQAQDTAEQTSAMIQREVGRLLQLALAAAQLPGVTPASGSVYAQSAPSADAVADAVRVELATELGRIDAAVSSRLATAGYTAPDNAGIAAIPGADENAAAVRGELAVELANIDASVSSRLAAASYTAPDNTPVPTAEQNANAILAAAQATPIHADLRKILGEVFGGTGTEANPWGPL